MIQRIKLITRMGYGMIIVSAIYEKSHGLVIYRIRKLILQTLPVFQE